MQIPLIKGDKIDSSVDYRDALPVNMSAVVRDIKGAKGYMLQWYGLTEFATGLGKSRGARWVSAEGFGGHYRVSGSRFIRVSTTGAVTDLGFISGSDQCSIDYSFNNIAIVGGGKLYYYSPTAGLREIIDPQIGSPIDIVWADGLFILTDGTDLYHSDPLDEESFLPADFGNAQFRPDMTNGLGINEDNELIAFGVKTSEYFINQGLDNFQYQRIQLKALKLGIMGPNCRKEMDGKWYLIGRREETSPAIHAAQGGSAEVISTREIDKILAEYSYDNLKLGTIDAFVRDGYKYVMINLPSHTLLFNETVAVSLGLSVAWSILKSDVDGDIPYRGKDFVLDIATSKWVCGDRASADIGLVSSAVATHYDNISEWILYTPLVKMESLSIDRLEIETISGFDSGDASVFISTTANGITYGKEHTALFSGEYEYTKRLILFALGYVRNFIGFKFRGATRSRAALSMFNVDAS